MNTLIEKNKCASYYLTHQTAQTGAVLIVSLVMLTILTVIILGTMTDTNLQTNMAKNSQISLRAFNVTLSELNAQFQSSKNNSVMNNAPYLETLASIRQTEQPFTIPQADLLMTSTDNPFSQDIVIRFLRVDSCGGGNEIENSGLIFEMDSTSKLSGTGINSNQSFGLCYPNPNSDSGT